VRLTVGDYLKVKTPAIGVLDIALEVIKWFNNHTGALSILRQQQQKQDGKVLALVRPAPTRWTAHYLSANRLLELERALRIIVLESKERLLVCAGKERAQTDKARTLIGHLETPQFWKSLAE
ncbi:hypothetical protein C2E23DRAFT_739372, partial [Lenzites betulinus]